MVDYLKKLKKAMVDYIEVNQVTLQFAHQVHFTNNLNTRAHISNHIKHQIIQMNNK